MEPLVTVVIPVGPGHMSHLDLAVGSLLTQPKGLWAAVVVDDTGSSEGFPDTVVAAAEAYPNIRLVHTQGREGVGVARNMGLDLTTTPFVSFLDADDYFVPNALDNLIRGYVSCPWAGYIYGDWWADCGDGLPLRINAAPQYDQARMFLGGQHVVTTLLLADDARDAGGFDPSLKGWEDWAFYCDLAARGICGHRVPLPIIVYRLHTGQRREASHKGGHPYMNVIQERYSECVALARKGQKMACCGGGRSGDRPRNLATERGFKAQPDAAHLVHGKNVLMEYTGNQKKRSWRSLRTGRTYHGGTDILHRFAWVDPNDVQWLASFRFWRVAPNQNPDLLPPEPPSLENYGINPPSTPAPIPAPASAPKPETMTERPTVQTAKKPAGVPKPPPLSAHQFTNVAPPVEPENRAFETLAPGELLSAPETHPDKNNEDGVR